MVTPLTAGKTTITVTAGDYTASFELTVTQPTLIASEDFENDLTIEQVNVGTDDAPNMNWFGRGEQLTFSGAGYDMQYSENPAHIPEGGSGHCLFWQPWDGSWSSLNITASDGVLFEAGKTYEINFLMKLAGHNVAPSGFNLFYQIDGGTDQILKAIDIAEVGATANFSAQLTVPEGATTVKVWISAKTTKGTQIVLDNVSIYEI